MVATIKRALQALRDETDCLYPEGDMTLDLPDLKFYEIRYWPGTRDHGSPSGRR